MHFASQFPLIDNLYSDGTNSASGHTWLDAGFVNDYLERSYANYVRNYGQPDAMVYPKSGFLWDNAQAHGLNAKVWGEYAEYFTRANGAAATGSWTDWYRDSQILEGKQTGEPHVPVGTFTTKTDVPSLAKILDPDYPNFNTRIPDQYRASMFISDFDAMEKKRTLPTSTCSGCPATTRTAPTPDSLPRQRCRPTVILRWGGSWTRSPTPRTGRAAPSL